MLWAPEEAGFLVYLCAKPVAIHTQRQKGGFHGPVFCVQKLARGSYSPACCKHHASTALPILALICVQSRLPGDEDSSLVANLYCLSPILHSLSSWEFVSLQCWDKTHGLLYYWAVSPSYHMLQLRWGCFTPRLEGISGTVIFAPSICILQLPDSDVKINLNPSLTSSANSDEHSILPLAAPMHVKLLV